MLYYKINIGINWKAKVNMCLLSFTDGSDDFHRFMTEIKILAEATHFSKKDEH